MRGIGSKKESKGRKDEKRKMKRNRIMIAAPKSGSGKTMITCGLLQALLDREEKVLAYKCGPDYIDPMFTEECWAFPAEIWIPSLPERKRPENFFWKAAQKGAFV